MLSLGPAGDDSADDYDVELYRRVDGVTVARKVVIGRGESQALLLATRGHRSGEAVAGQAAAACSAQSR